MNLKSALHALGAVLLWSTVATAFKLSMRGMSFAQLLFFSSLTSLIVLFLIGMLVSRQGIYEGFKFRFFYRNLLLGFLNPFLYYLVLFKAYSLLPAQEAQPLNYTWPIVLSVLSVIFLGDRFRIKTAIGLLSAFIGVWVIATRGDFLNLQFYNLFGVVLAAGSSLIWGTFWLINLIDKRAASDKLFASFLFGTPITGIYLFFFDDNVFPAAEYLLGAVYVGLFEMGITFFLWLKALDLSKDRGKTSTLAYLSPFLSLIFIHFILGETLLASSFLGLVFIIGGIVYQQVASDGKSRLSKE